MNENSNGLEKINTGPALAQRSEVQLEQLAGFSTREQLAVARNILLEISQKLAEADFELLAESPQSFTNFQRFLEAKFYTINHILTTIDEHVALEFPDKGFALKFLVAVKTALGRVSEGELQGTFGNDKNTKKVLSDLTKKITEARDEMRRLVVELPSEVLKFQKTKYHAMLSENEAYRKQLDTISELEADLALILDLITKGIYIGTPGKDLHKKYLTMDSFPDLKDARNIESALQSKLANTKADNDNLARQLIAQYKQAQVNS